MEPEKSFNDAMHDWAVKQSFFRNTGNRLIHPDPSLPWFFRLLGYLFRIAVIVFVLFFASRLAIKKIVMSKGFSEEAAANFAEMLDAEEFECTTLLWKGNRVSLKQFKATGSQQAFFRTIRADFVQFESHPLNLIGESWDLGTVVISDLAIDFRSGAVMEVPLSWNHAEPMRLMLAGLVDAPDFNKLTFEKIEVREANLQWGLAEWTHGSYEGGLVFSKEGGEKDWRIELSGGVFSQNWLKDAVVDRLTVRRIGDRLVFEDGLLIFGEGGTATVSGELSLGGLPEAKIRLMLANVDLAHLVPDPFNEYVDGRVSGALDISGSINTRSGIVFSGTLQISDGRFRKIPVFESLALVTQVSRFRQMPLSKGTFKLRTGEDSLRVDAIDIASDEFGRLRGGFGVSRSVELTTEERMINEQLKAEGKEMKREPYHFDGEIKIGVVPEKLVEHKAVSDRFFDSNSDGYSWMSVYLSGVASGLTKNVYDKMIEEVRIHREENR